MVIEPLVVQFWAEIIRVISNRTHAARSFDFEITRMISAQIALHSVQLPLFIRFSVSVDEEITFYPTLFLRLEPLIWFLRRESYGTSYFKQTSAVCLAKPQTVNDLSFGKTSHLDSHFGDQYQQTYSERL